MQYEISSHGMVGQRVQVAADDDYPEESGRIIFHSPDDPMLYVVLVDQAISPTDHRHRLVAGDVMVTE